MITVGNKFPSFELLACAELPADKLDMDNAFKTITDSTYKGKWQVIFFYPKDFTFVCPTEIAAFGRLCDAFQQRNAQILGCSVDSEFVHWAWRKHNPMLNVLPFPLMADTKRELSNALGILDPASGVAHRAVFIIDPDNVVRFVMVTDPIVGRNPDEVLRILDALQTGELCQCGWTKGSSTIDLTKVDM